MTKIYILAAVILTCQPAWADEVFPPVPYPLPTFYPDKQVWRPTPKELARAFPRPMPATILNPSKPTLAETFTKAMGIDAQPMPPVQPLE